MADVLCQQEFPANQGARRNNQQEILGSAARQPSSFILCTVVVCIAHSLTPLFADKPLYIQFSRPQLSLSYRTHHLRGGDPLRLLIRTV